MRLSPFIVNVLQAPHLYFCLEHHSVKHCMCSAITKMQCLV
uniref:Uncharacterized protein n=1 Tax=Arundo donax TaxID=35708 RepID=A0A0A8Z4M3_ARUDO